MASRAADATIKGYYYQFDTSILKLLKLPNNADSIVVEGIEDIDIRTATDLTTVQCKYLSKPNYIPSAVREPISLMLSHFMENKTSNPLNYVLYAHFTNEQAGTIKTIDRNALKSILTYKVAKSQKEFHTDNNITDADLDKFLSKFKFEFGYEFVEQQKYVIGKIQKYFSCNAFEAETIYYNNSLKIIIDKSIKKSEKDRTITKLEISNLANIKTILYNEWYIKTLTKDKYLITIQKYLKSMNALLPSKEKYFLIGESILNNSTTNLKISKFIENLIDKYYNQGRALRNAKPVTVILECDDNFIKEVKINLIDNEINFNDGYESLKFSPNLFSKAPLIQVSASGKIINSTYRVRVINKKTFDSNTIIAKKSDAFLSFSKNNVSFNGQDPKQFFNIQYCETIEDIFKILN